MSKYFYFIINPITINAHKVTENLLQSHFPAPDYQIEIHYSKNYEHIRSLTQEAIEKNVNAVIAVGGNGTVNAVVQDLKYTHIPLGILPTGGGNAFATTINLFSLKKAISTLKNGTTVSVDVGRAGHQQFGERCFLAMFAKGLSAIAADHLNQKGNSKSYTQYIYQLFRFLPKYKAKQTQIELNYQKKEFPFFELFIGNVSNYGKRSRLYAYTSVSDGLLDILMVKKMSAIRLFRFSLLTLFNRTDSVVDIVESQKASIIRLHFPEESKIHIDFESFTVKGNVLIDVLPKAIRVITPPQILL